MQVMPKADKVMDLSMECSEKVQYLICQQYCLKSSACTCDLERGGKVSITFIVTLLTSASCKRLAHLLPSGGSLRILYPVERSASFFPPR